jgi:hypothetical protein
MRIHPVAIAISLGAATLSWALPARADGAAEAAQAYRIETGDSTPSVKVGERGKLVLRIRPAQKWHVHPQAPLKIKLDAPSGLKLDKVELGRKDASDPAAEAPRFEVGFQGVSAGKQETRAAVDFFVCSDAACVKQSRTVAVTIDVK